MRKFEFKQISRGANSPGIDLSNRMFAEICYELHKRTPIEELPKKLGITKEEADKLVEQLLNEGLAVYDGSFYRPSFMVIPRQEGELLYKHSVDPGDQLVQTLLNRMDTIKKSISIHSAFKSFSFEELSLFILSDVMLDFIQIDNVEQFFLKKQRPDRNGKYYYLALMEKASEDPKEAFGIYGNHCVNFGTFQYCVYGNERYSGLNLISLDNSRAGRLFKEKTDPLEKLKSSILSNLIEKHSGRCKLQEKYREGLEKLGLIKDDALTFPVLTKSDYESLYDMADLFKDELLGILESYRTKFVENYQVSIYVKAISFEEYFIWYYHFLYSYVTERLIDIGAIQMPESRIFTYMIAE